MRMHIISPEFRGFRILFTYGRVTYTSAQNGKAGSTTWLTILCHIECAHCSSEMSSHASVVSVNFDQAPSYTLESLNTPEIKLKPE